MTRISDERLFVRTFRTDARLLMRIVLKLQQRYAHTRITDIWLRLKREWSVPLSSGVTNNVDHYNCTLIFLCSLLTTKILQKIPLLRNRVRWEGQYFRRWQDLMCTGKQSFDSHCLSRARQSEMTWGFAVWYWIWEMIMENTRRYSFTSSSAVWLSF